MNETVDVQVENLGASVVTVNPLTEAAHEWVEENVKLEPWQWLGNGAFAVEPRYLMDLVNGMRAAGLTVV